MGSPQVINNVEDIPKKLSEFINSWPLYSPFELSFEPLTTILPDLPQTILRDCDVCAGSPTWGRTGPNATASPIEYVGQGAVIAYYCTNCKKRDVRVWYLREDGTYERGNDGKGLGYKGCVFRKFGQWPPQEIEPSRELRKGLPKPVLDFFKKGLTSLSQGYGLGALAYFRRVVEDASQEVIDLFADRAVTDGNSKEAESIRATKKANMDDRLKLAAEALPLSMRPGNVNPLGVLYDNYSRGIHRQSEEECLAIAQQLYFALEYIFKNWRLQMEEAEKFRNSVQQWNNPPRKPEPQKLIEGE